MMKVFSLCKMNVIPSHVLTGALQLMKHAQGLTKLFLESNLFPTFVDKNVILPYELDPTARYVIVNDDCI